MITDPRGVLAALDNPDPRQPQPSCVENILDVPPISRQRRLDIYSEGYLLRLAKALEKDFPNIHLAVNSSYDSLAFRTLCLQYIEKYPSRYYSLNEIGRNFSTFLWDHPILEKLPFLGELAQVEWLCVQSHFAQDPTPFDWEKITQLSQETLGLATLLFHPSVFVIQTNWALGEFWNEAHTADFSHSTLKKISQSLLIYRRGHGLDQSVKVMPQDPMSNLIFTKALQQMCLNKICDEISSESENTVQQWFQTWVSAKVISGIAVAS